MTSSTFSGRPGRRTCTVALLGVLAAGAAAQVSLTLPLRPESVRFAVIGDTGTGNRSQYALGRLMARYHEVFPFTFVLMLGDNIYGRDLAIDYARKFERPYRPLLEAGVTFHATLGSEDKATQMFYPLFNMNGRRYYTFTVRSVRFLALDSQDLNADQLAWMETQLASATEPWKICFFHHPIYSSGSRHGSDVGLRRAYEPLFLKYGVNVVFSGHDHFYERLKPQSGIHYFVSGAGGRLREGNIREGAFTVAGFDRDLHFILVEIDGDELHFQAIARSGSIVDSGVISRFSASQTPER